MPDAAKPTLAEAQAQLFAFITRRPQRGSTPLAGARVYANMYFHRLLDALRADYPKLAAALGASSFQRLAADYLQTRPPSDPSVRHLGRALPGFVQGQAAVARRRWLADLAQLEWSRLDVHDRVDEDALQWEEVQRLPPTALAMLHLRLIAAHEVVRVRHAVDQVWSRIERGKRAGLPAKRTTSIIVWRQKDIVWHRAVPADEARLLHQVASGATFATVCEQLGHQLSAQKAARRAADLLTLWTSAELLVRPSERRQPGATKRRD